MVHDRSIQYIYKCNTMVNSLVMYLTYSPDTDIHIEKIDSYFPSP